MKSWKDVRKGSAPNTHEAAFDLFTAHVGKLAGLKICDVPAGAGAFSQRLIEEGALVSAVDIEAHGDFAPDCAVLTLADANLGLPFPDAGFDAVASIEGIEHLENPSFFLREMARILKPGGWALVTTPNVDSFRSRQYRLLRGHYKFFRPESATARQYGHLHPIDMVFFKGAAQKAGLTLVATAINEQTERHAWLKEMFRQWLSRYWPSEMQGRIPFYGDVIVYLLRKPG